jgi:hypothetical protein
LIEIYEDKETPTWVILRRLASALHEGSISTQNLRLQETGEKNKHPTLDAI